MKDFSTEKIPVDERCINDWDVFHAFDLTQPGLEGVSQALQSNDTKKAKKLLIDYMQTRTNVQYLYDYRSLPLVPIDTDSNPHDFQSSLGLNGSLKEFCLYAGRQLMNHVYVRPGRDRTIIDLGDAYQFLPHFNYLTDLGKKQRTLSDIFVRGQIFEYLTILYHETGDKSVLDKLEEVLKVFWKEYPLILEYTLPDASRFCLSEDRDVMSTGWLILTYVSLFYSRIPYEISTDLSFEIIKRIWFLGIQFRRFDTDTYRLYNHHMWERGLVPFLLGLLFPEIPDFTPMKNRGASVICQHILDDFNEEGGYSEHSIPYWSGAALCEMLCRGICLADKNKADLLTDECRKRLDLTFYALAMISPPHKLYSSIGDNGGPMVDPILKTGVKTLDQPHCREVLKLRHSAKTCGDDTIPKDFCNDRCGFFSARSSFLQDANFILMSVKVDCKDSGHNHMDMLSLFLTFGGQEFIGEPHARQLYQRNRMNSDHRGYLYNMGSHNTVLAYGNPVQPDTMYANKWGVYRPDSPVTAFTSLKDGCYVKAHHDAYTTCRHNRSILFHRNTGLLLYDTIEHGNRLDKAHIQRWHLLPDVTYRQISNHAVVLMKNNVSLLFLWNGSPSLSIWQKTDLQPEIVREGEPLSTIIDVSFQAGTEKELDIACVSQGLLVLDITGLSLPEINMDKLAANAFSIHENKDILSALKQFDQLL